MVQGTKEKMIFAIATLALVVAAGVVMHSSVSSQLKSLEARLSNEVTQLVNGLRTVEKGTRPDPSFGGSTGFSQIEFQDGDTSTTTDATVQEVVDYQTISLGSGEDQKLITNVANSACTTWYIDDALLYLDGTASSSFRYYAFATSSNAGFADSLNGTAPTKRDDTRFLFFNEIFATSTATTTYNSLDSRIEGRGRGLVSTECGDSFGVYLQAVDSLACQYAGGDGNTVGACEAATSTARGTNFELRYRLRATTTTDRL